MLLVDVVSLPIVDVTVDMARGRDRSSSMIISASVNLVDVACWAAIAVAVLGAVVGWALSEHNSRISRIASAMTNIEQRLAEVNAQRAEEQGRLQPRGTSGEPGSPPGCSGNLTTGTLGVSGAVTSFHIHGAFYSLTENFFLQFKTKHLILSRLGWSEAKVITLRVSAADSRRA